MNETRLIVNADDFGMSQGITDGVLLAHRYGFLTSASLMVNMPASEYAVAQAPHSRHMSVGIHLNICQGRPVLPPSQVPSLVDAHGNFLPPAEIIPRLWRWQISPRQLEAEFRAQIHWMKQRGCAPTHADSHHHMHIYPAAALPFARALRAEGVSCARTSRCAQFPTSDALGGPHEGSLSRRIFVQAYRAALDATILCSFHSPDRRISFPSRERHNLNLLASRWKSTLAHLPTGTYELACHPGFFERGFSETDRIHLQREEELRWLTDHEFRVILNHSEIHLITYHEIGGQGATQVGEQLQDQISSKATGTRASQGMPALRHIS